MGERHRAAIRTGLGSYGPAPFDPSLPFAEYDGPVSPVANPAYGGVREVLAILYPPGERYGTGGAWNPLSELVEPGQTVFIKPNLVDHEHRHGGDVWSVITHPAVVRAVADYVALALKGEGRILIGDNPHIDCDWDAICALYHSDMLCERVARGGVDVDFVDLRSWHMPDLSGYGWRHRREELPGDPRGDRVIETADSYLDGQSWWLFRGTFNERLETVRSHRRHHRYSFSATMLDADTFVSVPKLKAHAKVGATLNIKGLIGTIVNKNCLVHWSLGYPRFGGDEYPEPEHKADYLRLYWQHLLTDLLPSRVHERLAGRFGHTAVGRAYTRAVTTEGQRQRLLRGAWDGNDTTWRMTADVHDAFIGMPGQPLRSTLSIVDGIVGGDTDGPHFPHRTKPGTIVGAENLLIADLVATRLMDFRIEDVRYLGALADNHGVQLDDIDVLSVAPGGSQNFFDAHHHYLGFRPPHRWPSLSLHDLAPAESPHDLGRAATTPALGAYQHGATVNPSTGSRSPRQQEPAA